MKTIYAKVHFSKLVSPSNFTDNHENIPLHPLIIESDSNPTILTRKFFPQNTIPQIISAEYDETQLNQCFKTLLGNKKCALKVNQDLSMKQLEIIVNNGLKGLNKLLYSDLFDLFEKSKEPNNEQSTKMEKLTGKLLYANYGYVRRRGF